MDELDRIFEAAMCDHWWLPEDAVVVRRPEIEYFSSPSGDGRLNAVVRIAPDLPDYGALVREVMDAHRGRASSWRIGAPSYSPALEAALLKAGYESSGMGDLWSTSVDAPRPPEAADVRVEPVVDLRGMRDMNRVMAAAFDAFPAMSDEDLRSDMSTCIGPDARCLRFVAYETGTGQPVSTGALNLFPGQRLGFLWGGSTVKEARGRGLYSTLVTARMRRAKARGCIRLALQAMRHSSGPIVEAQGFERHGPCTFWDLRPRP